MKAGERPTSLQIITFGAAGGLVPCPASVTVMLMALSIGQAGFGLLAVLGFSLGLAVTLVGVGLMVVAGLTRLSGTSRFSWLGRKAPLISVKVPIDIWLHGLSVVPVTRSGPWTSDLGPIFMPELRSSAVRDRLKA